MNPTAIGISWYHRRDYEALRAIFTDGASLPATYEEWHAKAKELEKEMRQKGGRVIRAYVDPVEFPKWCEQTGNKADSRGRVVYGSVIAAETVSKEHAGSSKKTKKWQQPR